MDNKTENSNLAKIYLAIDNGENIILSGSGGCGKCLHPDQGVLMYDGSVKKSKNIQKHDLLMGDDSTPRKVFSTCTGEDEMFCITTSKKDTFTVNSAHILSLKCSYDNEIKWNSSSESYIVSWNENGVRKSKIFPVSKWGSKEVAEVKSKEFLLTLTSGKGEVVDISVVDYLSKSKDWKDQYLLFKVGVDFSDTKEELLIDPYFLGLWLGNGTSCSTSVTTIDPEIIEWLTKHAEQLDSLDHNTEPNRISYSTIGGIEEDKLKILNLNKNKHIPNHYLKGSRYTRMKVLAGLLDSSGYMYENMYEIFENNSKLMEDIIFLARSLGFACYSRLCEKTDTYNRVTIFGDGLEYIPLLLHKKKVSPCNKIKDALVLEFEITSLGKGEYCGFTIDGNHRFLLDNFIVTHNTFSLCKIAEYLTKKSKVVCCTATTGVAAINLNVPECKISGSTLHSWAGVGLAKDIPKKLHAKVYHDKRASNRWLHTDVLIIDEVSMLGADFIDKLDYIGRGIRTEKDKPFGGIQLILSGDFLQLPPVNEEWCFKSFVWEKLDLIPFIFDKPYRYEDLDYFKLLLRVRKGNQTPEDIGKLRARTRSYDKLLKALKEAKGHNVIKPTILYSKKVDVDYYNEQELGKLSGSEIEYIADDKFTPYNKKAKHDFYINKLDSIAPKTISLKVGAQVMLKCNLDVKGGLVNGSRGVILEAEPGSVYVRFVNGTKLRVKKQNWDIEDKDGKGARSQLPFILAYSITIHKAQGCTLDYAVCDLGPNVFAPGQAYVALSRVRSLRGLFISDLYPSCIKVDKSALKHSNHLETLAKQYMPLFAKKEEYDSDEDFDFPELNI